MSYTKEEQAANRAKWVEALRSGDYEQGKTYLREGDKFCCLGVACDIAIKSGLTLEAEPTVFEDEPEVWTYDGVESVLPSSVMRWLGLERPSGPLAEEIKAPGASALWELNDKSLYSFERIADVIDAGLIRLERQP